MAAEGMVHALTTIYRLLAPDGILIDLHPSGLPAVIEAHVGGRARVVGHIRETDDFVEYRQADAALRQVVDAGLFALERAGAFDFTYQADSLADLQAYLAAEWADAVLEPAVVRRAALLGGPGPGRALIMREWVKIARLRRNASRNESETGLV